MRENHSYLGSGSLDIGLLIKILYVE